MNKTANLRRIQNEIKHLDQSHTAEYIKMFKINMVEDDVYHWDVTLYGPGDSLYEGYEFKLDIRLPDDYPFSAPRVKFITPIQHVNINAKGDICLDILKDRWAPSQNIKTIILSIILLLSQPNPKDPFNADLAQLYRTDEKKYVQEIKRFCKKNCKKIADE
jgi:ubiquitin-conjugating enzyme E2 D/E